MVGALLTVNMVRRLIIIDPLSPPYGQGCWLFLGIPICLLGFPDELEDDCGGPGRLWDLETRCPGVPDHPNLSQLDHPWARR